MRSRFSAFALGLGAYLVETLAADHEDLLDKGSPEERALLAHALGAAKHRQRFLGLRILDSKEGADGEGEVFFRARIFERGVDRSFYELSRFRREPSGWRYSGGDLLTAANVPEDGDPTVERFLEILASSLT
jgi:SEC-C motif-containing protein